MKNAILTCLCGLMIALHCYPQQMPDVQTGETFYDFVHKFNTENPIDTVPEGGIYGNVYKTNIIWGPRLSPTGFVQTAAQAYINYAQNFTVDTSQSNVNWTSMGPTGLAFNADPHFDGTNGVGQIQRIAFDPFYNGTSNQVVYASSSWGGLWRSDNDGGDWYMLNTDHQLPITSVADVAVHPNSSDTIFIATGDCDGGIGLFYSANTCGINPVFTFGVYRSVDYGETWQPINTNLLQHFNNEGTIRKMAINPENPNQIFLAASNGVYRTNNACAADPNWVKAFHGNDTLEYENFRGIAYKPFSDSIVYASGFDIYRSNDGGDSWNSMTGASVGLDLGGFPNHFKVRRINIATTLADSSRLFAYINGSEYRTKSNGDDIHGSRLYIYKYEDFVWDSLFSVVDYDTIYDPFIQGYLNPYRAVSPTWMPFAVSPVDADRLVFGHTMAWGTTDLLNFESAGYSGSRFHADIHALEFQPNMANPGIFRGDDGGIGFKDDSDKDINYGWEKRLNGLSVNNTWTFDVSELYEDLIVIGNQDCGGFIGSNMGNNWEIFHSGDGFGERIHPVIQDYIYYHTNAGTWMGQYNYFTRERFSPFRPNDPGANAGAMTPNTFHVQEDYADGTVIFGFTELFDMLEIPGSKEDDVWEVDSDIYKLYPPEQQASRSIRQISELAMSSSNPDIIYLSTLGGYSSIDSSSNVFPFKTI
jgi:hypothetical protein